MRETNRSQQDGLVPLCGTNADPRNPGNPYTRRACRVACPVFLPLCGASEVMKKIVLMTACLMSVSAWGQTGGKTLTEKTLPLEPYTLICIEEQSSGFSWENGQWKPARFKAGDKYQVRRLDPRTLKDVAATDEPIACRSGDFFTGHKLESFLGEDATFIRSACYTIKRFGEKSIPMFDGEICAEEFTRTELKKVECKSMHFKPNGAFIKLPVYTSMDLDPKPTNDYKDSMALGLGTCSTLD